MLGTPNIGTILCRANFVRVQKGFRPQRLTFCYYESCLTPLSVQARNKKPQKSNPLPENLFFLFTNFQVGAGESHSIGLRFAPQQFPGKAEILIFINDAEDKNEETFSISAQYT